MAIYSVAIKRLRSVDVDMMEYIKNNNDCSDGALNYSMALFTESYFHDLNVLWTGLGFTIASILGLVFIIIFTRILDR